MAPFFFSRAGFFGIALFFLRAKLYKLTAFFFQKGAFLFPPFFALVFFWFNFFSALFFQKQKKAKHFLAPLFCPFFFLFKPPFFFKGPFFRPCFFFPPLILHSLDNRGLRGCGRGVKDRAGEVEKPGRGSGWNTFEIQYLLDPTLLNS